MPFESHKDLYCLNERDFREHEITTIGDNIIQYKCLTCNDIEWFFLFEEMDLEIPMDIITGFIKDEKNRQYLQSIDYLDKVNESIKNYKEKILNGRGKQSINDKN